MYPKRSSTTPLGPAFLAALVAALACTSEDPAATEGATTGRFDSSGTGSSAPTDSSATSDHEPGVLVRGGLTIVEIEANQGVGVSIVRDGAVVPLDERAAPLLPRRETVIRAFWGALPPDWIPRPILGRLSLEHADGTRETLETLVVVDRAAAPSSYELNLAWRLPADRALPGLKFSVGLYETAEGLAALAPDVADGAVVPVFPQDGGRAELGFEAAPHVLQVTMIPIAYDDGLGCVTTPTFTEDRLATLREGLFDVFPVEEVQLVLHKPIVYPQPLTNFAELNEFLVARRAEEHAAPNEYYIGVVDVCALDLDGSWGTSVMRPPEPTQENAWMRVMAVLDLDTLFPDWPEIMRDRLVRVLGQAQGRMAVKCRGDEFEPDPDYPVDGGAIEAWGINVRSGGLVDPFSHRDYMSACVPRWTSTYGWKLTHDVVHALSSWD